MSVVDTYFAPSERQAFLEEIRESLPAFLSPAAAERPDPAGDVRELLNLRREDLRRVIAVHLALSEPTCAFISALRRGLRSPLTSSERPRIATQAVRGPIDWHATIRERASSGWDRTRFVVRPARRVFDTPENRALVWLLSRLDNELRRASPAESDPDAGVHDVSWMGRIVEMRAAIQAARRHHWLRGIEPQRPDARTLLSLRSTRSAFYKKLIPSALDAIKRLTEDEPSADDITSLLSDRYFEPERDWRLFELVVALRLARGIAAESASKRKSRLLIGAGRSPYARYVMPDGDEIRLWYQAWPRDVGFSIHTDARLRYEIASGPARPDIVVQRVRDGTAIDTLLLELKASRHPGTLGEGLLQMLGYIKDRSTLFEHSPYGWLVALPSDAFRSQNPEGSELWVVDSDHVVDAVVTRLANPVPSAA